MKNRMVHLSLVICTILTLCISLAISAPTTVQASGSAPFAYSRLYTMNESAILRSKLRVYDAENDKLTYMIVSNPVHGTVDIKTAGINGFFAYTPGAGWSGSDSFTFKANDGTSDSNIAKIQINVRSINHAPTAVNDSYTTDEDVALNVSSANGVLANDTDPDAKDTHTAFWVAGPLHAVQFVLNSDGSFSYTPDPNWNGTDTFTYRVRDAKSMSTNEGTVTITVSPVNDAPQAFNDTYLTTKNSTLDVSGAEGVLSNDVDIESNPITAVPKKEATSQGFIDLKSDGSFTYIPNSDWTGEDSFTYYAQDATLLSQPATVKITTSWSNSKPVAADMNVIVNEDTSLSGTLQASDPDQGDQLQFAMITGPSNGHLFLDATGSFTYIPDFNYSGPDSFTFNAKDSFQATSKAATVSITVNPVNDVPVAEDLHSFTGTEDVSFNGSLMVSDVDSTVLTCSVDSQPAHGAVQFTNPATGTNPKTCSFTYTPDSNWNGDDSFTYIVKDDQLAASAPATVLIILTPVNDAPVAQNASLTVEVNKAIQGQAVAIDVDGDMLLYYQISYPAHGTVAFQPDGTFTYTPNKDWTGSDNFYFHVVDDWDTVSNNAVIGILVVPVAQVPGNPKIYLPLVRK